MKSSRIDRILVANRGEIAIRVIRTCRDMGIDTVAIFADADRDAPHVRMADDSIHVGSSLVADSYLNQDAVIAAAIASGADAIHPGYGFLSENHSFARRVEKAGITFIGPPYRAMKLLGDKTEARKLARKHGVPITKGTVAPVTSGATLRRVSREIGFPVLLKAAGGGGGKGMKIVRSESELESSFRIAQSEAKSAFGDERVYVEQYVSNPRHIEVQVLADTFGNVRHLGERECSVQRRHQKIIEETPSPVVSPALRKKITSAAITLIRKARYHGAATVEFLLDEKGRFYFLEVNTRLQVEHPVTEMCTGLDLVREQIRIAEGKELDFRQQDIQFRGWALECRIYAEDPTNSFFPSTGRILFLRSPQGPFTRVDSGIEEGIEVTPYFDPLLMKIIVWGESRSEALRRMTRALSELRVFGVNHNAGLCEWVIGHELFASGNFSTHFLDQHFQGAETLSPESSEVDEIAAIAASVHNSGDRLSSSTLPEHPAGKWKAGRTRLLR
jgi:propionyl-CoA carboxylase alpha chain